MNGFQCSGKEARRAKATLRPSGLGANNSREEFGPLLSDLGELSLYSGLAPAGLLLKRATSRLATIDDRVWLWFDSLELAQGAEAALVASLLNEILTERSRLRLQTHVRTVTRSIVDSMEDVVARSSYTARLSLGVGADKVVPEGLLEQYQATREQLVTEAVQDNLATERQLFAWHELFTDGVYLGTLDFRGISNQNGCDYMMVGVGSNVKMLSECVIVRSERCQGTYPFEGAGVTVDPWTLAGAEVERKMAERWHEAVKNPPAVHSENFVRNSIAIWDANRELQNREAASSVVISASLLADINNPS